MTLIEELKDFFLREHYDEIPTDLPNVSMFGTISANLLYLINIIELQSDYTFDMDRYLEYKQMILSQFYHEEYKQIILLNLVITENIEGLKPKFAFTPDLTEVMVDVNWLIDPRDRTLIIPNKQLKDVLNLRKAIKGMLLGEKRKVYEIKTRQSSPIATYSLIIINVIIWLILEQLGGSTNLQVLISAGALSRDLVASGQYWRLVTSMFLHIGLAHLFHNMFSLYIFGYRLEKFLSPVFFALVYLGSGMVGAIFSMTASTVLGTHVIAAGASGAVYGLMGSLLFITLKARASVDGVNTYILWLFFVVGIVYSIYAPNVDIFAHIGGFVGGLLLTPLFIEQKKA